MSCPYLTARRPHWDTPPAPAHLACCCAATILLTSSKAAPRDRKEVKVSTNAPRRILMELGKPRLECLDTHVMD